jgi:hypothetical protein
MVRGRGRGRGRVMVRGRVRVMVRGRVRVRATRSPLASSEGWGRRCA